MNGRLSLLGFSVAAMCMFTQSLLAAPLDDIELELPEQPEATKSPAPATTESTTDPAPLSATEQAMQAYRRGDMEECLSHLRDLVAQKPTLPPPGLILAGFHVQARRHALAREELERIAATGSKHPQLFLTLSDLALAEGRLTDAWSHLEVAHRLGPPSNWSEKEQRWFRAAISRNRTAIAEIRGNWSEAVSHLELWLEQTPNSIPVRKRYATALFAAGKPSQAFEQFDLVYRRDEQQNPPEVAMAVLNFRERRFDRSEHWYKKAIEAHPSNATVRLEWAIALLHQDRAEDARKQSQMAEQLGLRSAALYVNRGMIARQLNETDEAISYLERALEQNPGHREATRQLALTLANLDERPGRQRALTLVEAIERTDNPRTKDVLTRAWVSYRAGKEDAARHLVQDALHELPSDSESLFLLGRLLVGLDEIDRARAVASRLRERIDEPGLFVMRPAARNWLKYLPE